MGGIFYDKCPLNDGVDNSGLILNSTVIVKSKR